MPDGPYPLSEVLTNLALAGAFIALLFRFRSQVHAAHAKSRPLARRAFTGIGLLALVLGVVISGAYLVHLGSGGKVDHFEGVLGFWNLVAGTCWLLLIYPRPRSDEDLAGKGA